MTLLEVVQEARRIVDVAVRVEHFAHIREVLGMVVVVDLHAAEVDQLDALAARVLEGGTRLRRRTGEDGLAGDVEGIGLQATPDAGFRQTDRVEYSRRYAVFVRGA